MTATTLTGNRINNPGNGSYQLWPHGAITSITVVTDEGSLTGLLTFKIGGHDMKIDLAAGERFIGLSAKVPMLYMDVSGVAVDANFLIILS